jgi:hypothetical protein
LTECAKNVIFHIKYTEIHGKTEKIGIILWNLKERSRKRGIVLLCDHKIASYGHVTVNWRRGCALKTHGQTRRSGNFELGGKRGIVHFFDAFSQK